MKLNFPTLFSCWFVGVFYTTLIALSSWGISKHVDWQNVIATFVIINMIQCLDSKISLLAKRQELGHNQKPDE